MRNYFFTGLISISPIFLTVFILIQIAEYTVKLFSKLFSVNKLREFIIKSFNIENKVFTQLAVSIVIYGIAIIVIYLIVMLIGLMVSKLINKEKIKYFENFFLKIPLAKPIYITLKQIREIILSQNGRSYKKVLLIEYPRKGIYSLGFLTNDKNNFFEKILSEKELVNVFIPTSPNPTSGMFVMVHKQEAIELDMRIEDAIKLIISGGAIIPESLEKN